MAPAGTFLAGGCLFRLTEAEREGLTRRSTKPPSADRSQIVTGSQKHRDPRFLPYAFTEHGAIMAAPVLQARAPRKGRRIRENPRSTEKVIQPLGNRPLRHFGNYRIAIVPFLTKLAEGYLRICAIEQMGE